MNRKEIAEIKRRLNPDRNAISCIRGCYVGPKGQIISMFHRPLLSLPQEECEHYLALFRRTLTGAMGRNLLEITFRPDQVMNGPEHQLLSAMRNTQLKVEEGVQAFYQKIIDSVSMEGNYLILLMHESYDLPYITRDEQKVDDASEEVFDYIICCLCPVKMGKSALSYFSQDNDFHDRDGSWVVSAPELGFLFPAFDDRQANIYSALYYTRDADDVHDDFLTAVFNASTPAPADEQQETFHALLEDTLGDSLDMSVMQAVTDQIRTRIDEQLEDKSAPAPTVDKREIVSALERSGVPQEQVTAFEEAFDEEYGAGQPLNAVNLVQRKKLEVRTPDVVISVNPERGDLLETRLIDGQRYILIRAEEGVEVNGVSIHIRES